MTRAAKLIAATCCVLAISVSAPAEAANPATGTLSKTKRSISWQGADASISGVAFDPAGTFDCNFFGDPTCDHFTLKIDLGEGAKIQLQIKGTDPSDETEAGKVYNDFDVYIYPPGSNNPAPIAQGTSPNGNETVTFVHRARFRKQAYDIAVRPWLVTPGATYKGSVKAVTLGK
jgi:hypothetical protein